MADTNTAETKVAEAISIQDQLQAATDALRQEKINRLLAEKTACEAWITTNQINIQNIMRDLKDLGWQPQLVK